MDSYQKYLSPQTLAKLQGLELRAQHIVEGYVSGLHKSPFHGFSIEFAQHREYVPGDDLRYVDWKVFGRTDKYYLKQYEEETNLTCHLLLDVSKSMAYQSSEAALSKLEYAQCIAASLAYLILQQQDSVGLVTFDQEVEALIPDSSNPSQLKQLLHTMEQTKAREKTNLGQILHEMAERVSRRGIVVLLSDLFDDVSQLVAGLKHLRYRRHEVVVLHILDPAELEFPFRDPTLFRGLEEEQQLLTDPRSLRKAYLAAFQQYCHDVQQNCLMQNVDYTLIRTDQSLDLALSKYLASRTARRR